VKRQERSAEAIEAGERERAPRGGRAVGPVGWLSSKDWSNLFDAKVSTRLSGRAQMKGNIGQLMKQAQMMRRTCAACRNKPRHARWSKGSSGAGM